MAVRDKTMDRATLRLFWNATLENKRLFWLAMLNPIGVICLSTLAPFMVGKILASLALPTTSPGQYLPYLAIFGIAGVLANRIGFLNMMYFQAKTTKLLQKRALDALLGRSVGFHNNNIGGKLVSDAVDFAQAYQKLSGTVFVQMLPFAITLITGSIAVAIESWQLGLVIFSISILIMAWGLRDSRSRIPFRHERLKSSKAVTGHLADTVLNVQTVKMFARENRELTTHNKLSQKLLEHRIRDWGRAGIQGNNRIIALLVMQFIFILVVVPMVQRDPSLLGVGIFGFSFLITLGNRLFEVDTMVRNLEDALLEASPMTEIILATPEIQDKPGARSLRVRKGKVELKDVKFRYQDSTAQGDIFSKLGLEIRPGEKIGLVGPSGGGKSTLTRLLMRFEDINDGQILIDGQNIAEATQSSLRAALAYVPQEPLLFHRSIRENIAYGNDRASLKDIKRVAHFAHADEFIEELPDGYETIVGERGVKLSGGQRQRIAIARAILKDAPILVLDEATSALDSESEVLIQEALWKLMDGRTAIVIAHRLSTIQRMDRIVVMEDGTIAEEGTHKQLLKNKGLYAKLWAHQSGGFLED